MQAITSGIVSALVIAFLAFLMDAARRGIPTVDPVTGSLVFRYNNFLRGFALFEAFGMPVGITALVIAIPPKNQGEYLTVLGLYCYQA